MIRPRPDELDGGDDGAGDVGLAVDWAPAESAADGRGDVVVWLRGEAGGPRQAERLDVALRRVSAARPRLVVVDLSGLIFLSSLGMGALLAFRHALARFGGHVRLRGAREEVRLTLRRSHLHRIFEIEGDPDALLDDDDEDYAEFDKGQPPSA
jgi:anti-sigma B factor antagonist